MLNCFRRLWLPVAGSRAVAGNCVVAVPVFFSRVGRAGGSLTREPHRDAFGHKHDHRSRIDRHATILWVLFPQQRNRATVSLTSLDYASLTGNEHVCEFTPVLLVVINQ